MLLGERLWKEGGLKWDSLYFRGKFDFFIFPSLFLFSYVWAFISRMIPYYSV